MNRILSLFQNQKQFGFLSVLALYLLLMIPGLSTYKSILCDEAWYANTAYNFSLGKGFINEIAYKGSNTNFILPFFVGISFKLFGVSLFAARLVSVISGLIYLLFLRKIFTFLQVSHLNQLFAFLIVLSISFFNSVFRYARPEGVAIAFLVAAIYLYLLFIESRQYRHFYLMSFMLYFSFLSHPFMAIFFLCIGVHLFILSIKEKNKALFYNLIFLFCTGVFSVFTLVLADCYYNYHSLDIFQAGIDVLNRTSIRSIKPDTLSDRIGKFIEAYILSNRVIFSIPLFLIVIYGLFVQNKYVKLLSCITLIHFVLTFFIFKNDIGMFPTTHSYFLAVSVIIFPFVFENGLKKYKVIIFSLTILLIALNFFATTYNNLKKKEYVNIQLANEFKMIVPSNSSVFGPIEFWFFLPNTHYISNMYLKSKLNFADFEYVILQNTPANGIFSAENAIYTLVYVNSSKQYGKIELYKRIKQ